MVPSGVMFTDDTSPLGWLWPCPQIPRPDWKGFPSTKPSSLLGLSVNDEGKKFYNIDHTCQYYKTFFVLSSSL